MSISAKRILIKNENLNLGSVSYVLLVMHTTGLLVTCVMCTRPGKGQVVWLSLHCDFMLWFIVCTYLYISMYWHFFTAGVFVSIARGCGQCLNFNPVIVVLLMMRRGLTWLRSTRLAVLLPLDQHIELHKLVGFVIFIFSTIHVLAHLSNFSMLITYTCYCLICSSYS